MAKLKYQYFILVLFTGLFHQVLAQDSAPLLTLFTTSQERQLIDNNRYKRENPTQVSPTTEPVIEPEVATQIPKVEVNVTYKISGVSTNTEGSKTAWVNGKSYVSGETMDDGSKIRIRGTSVILITEDGESHTGVSGEVLNVTYLKPANE